MKHPLAWASVLLLAAGAAAYGSSRAVWAQALAQDGLGTPRGVRVLGADFAPLTIALAVLLVAAVPAVFAVKGAALRAVAAAILLAGAGLVWTGAEWLLDNPDPAQVARLASLPERYRVDQLAVHRERGAIPAASGALAVSAAFFALRAARSAQGLGSRFDPPGAKKARPRSDWEVLDSGGDPTL